MIGSDEGSDGAIACCAGSKKRFSALRVDGKWAPIFQHKMLIGLFSMNAIAANVPKSLAIPIGVKTTSQTHVADYRRDHMQRWRPKELLILINFCDETPWTLRPPVLKYAKAHWQSFASFIGCRDLLRTCHPHHASMASHPAAHKGVTRMVRALLKLALLSPTHILCCAGVLRVARTKQFRAEHARAWLGLLSSLVST